MSGKKVFLSIAGALSISSFSTQNIFDNKHITIANKNDNITSQNIYFLSDYEYKNQVVVNNFTKQSINNTFNEKQIIDEIKSTILKDLKKENEMSIEYIDNSIELKNHFDKYVFSAIFSFNLKNGYIWDDKSTDLKYCEINFSNVRVINLINSWNVFINSYSKYEEIMNLNNQWQHNLKFFINENFKSLIDKKIIIGNNLTFSNKKYISFKYINIPKNNDFLSNILNLNESCLSIFWIEANDKNIPFVNENIKAKVNLNFNNINKKTILEFFQKDQNKISLLESINKKDYSNVVFTFTNNVKFKDNKYFLEFNVLTKNNNCFEDGKYQKTIWIELLINKHNNLIEYVEIGNYFTINAWWSKGFDLKNIKQEIFSNNNLKIFKNKFEDKYKKLKIINFINESASVEKYANQWEKNLKAYIDVIVHPNKGFKWENNKNNSKTIRLFIDGWYVTNSKTQ